MYVCLCVCLYPKTAWLPVPSLCPNVTLKGLSGGKTWNWIYGCTVCLTMCSCAFLLVFSLYHLYPVCLCVYTCPSCSLLLNLWCFMCSHVLCFFFFDSSLYLLCFDPNCFWSRTIRFDFRLALYFCLPFVNKSRAFLFFSNWVFAFESMKLLTY